MSRVSLTTAPHPALVLGLLALIATPPAPAAEECAFCPAMIAVPAGRFVMGSSGTETVAQGADARRVGNEAPAHEATIARPFLLGRTEVTRREFAAFVAGSQRAMAGCANWENGGWVTRADLDWRNPGFAQTDEDPVVCVSWLDAQAYVEWLAQRTGHRLRLPTEAEWEYAARAGHPGTHDWAAEADACRHANGADLAATRAQDLPARPGVAFACDDGFAWTSPAGHFPPNAFGLQDMLGNAWEWVEDCYNASYAGAPVDGSAWRTGNCDMHLLRGGSWKYPARTVRFAIRGPGRADARTNNAGFRVAADIVTPE